MLDNRILNTAYAAALEDMEGAPAMPGLKLGKQMKRTDVWKMMEKRRAYQDYQKDLERIQLRTNIKNETWMALDLLKKDINER